MKCAIIPQEGALGGSVGRQTAKLEATPLNRDHKPELADEAERILKRGGRIDSFRDYYNNGEPIGPQRVWLKNEEVPGLAMSRSMGDKVAHSVGVSADPEVMEFTLGHNDKFVVIASDGVWEFLSNEDVAQIVLPYYE
jgi:serine/threonine protein phosphatase PrpC